MAEAKAEAEWDHTASLMALIAEVNRNHEARSRPYAPAEFHPMHQRTKTPRREMSEAEAAARLYALSGHRPPAPPALWDRIKAGTYRPGEPPA